ncbi:MAG: hypothetical protein B7Z68_00250 [Acidobacteria bacterium 21-70-11]|nr:MAG: hypothetical protein B7Z68_00250 [Acidobacteria bacterium 21-70-11]
MLSRVKLPPAVLVAFWAALYLPHLFAGQTLPARDVAVTQIPWRTVWRAQVLSGWAPLWDPASSGGRPLLANPNAMAAYPGTLLFLLMSPEAAAGWHLALHHLLLLLGCYRLARRSGAARGAAAVAAAAAGTCGVAWSSLTFLNLQASLVWAVWALATVARPPAPGRPARERALATGALLGLSFLAGEPVTAALGAAACAVVTLAWWRPRPWVHVAVMAGAAAMLAAPVLVPLLAIFPETVRGGLAPAAGALAADALAPRRFLEVVFPNLLGAPLGNLATGFWAAPSFPWQRYFPLVFLGAIPLLALPFAARRPRLAPWWGLAAAGAAAATVLGFPALAAWGQDVPGLDGMRYAVKFLVLVVLALPPLVAAGWTELARRWLPSGRRAARAAALGALLLAPAAFAPGALLRPVLAALYPASRQALGEFPAAALRRAALTDWAALAVPLAAVALAGPSAVVVTAAALAANTAAASGVLLFAGDAAWAAPPPLRTALPSRPVVAIVQLTEPPPHEPSPLARFWRQHRELLPEAGTRWGVAYVLTRGPDGLEPVRQELLAAASAHMGPAERARLAAALGANAVIAASPLAGWQGATVGGLWAGTVPHPSPRAYLAHRFLQADNMIAAATIMAAESFRPGEDAVVPGGGGAVAAGGGAVRELAGPPHDRRFDVEADGPGLLVVQQSFMSGWRARVDGRPATVEPANGACIGIHVPGGRHRVEVALDPVPYRAGLAGPVLLLLFAALSRAAGSSRGRAASSGGAARTIPATPPAP